MPRCARNVEEYTRGRSPRDPRLFEAMFANRQLEICSRCFYPLMEHIDVRQPPRTVGFALRHGEVIETSATEMLYNMCPCAVTQRSRAELSDGVFVPSGIFLVDGRPTFFELQHPDNVVLYRPFTEDMGDPELVAGVRRIREARYTRDEHVAALSPEEFARHFSNVCQSRRQRDEELMPGFPLPWVSVPRSSTSHDQLLAETPQQHARNRRMAERFKNVICVNCGDKFSEHGHDYEVIHNPELPGGKRYTNIYVCKDGRGRFKPMSDKPTMKPGEPLHEMFIQGADQFGQADPKTLDMDRFEEAVTKLRQLQTGAKELYIGTDKFDQVVEYLMELYEGFPPLKMLQDLTSYHQTLARQLETEELPTMLQAAGVKKLKTSSGTEVVIKEIVAATMGDEEKFTAWAQENGYADILKVKFTVRKGDDLVAARTKLTESGVNFTEGLDKSGLSQSLGKLARERLENDQPLPSDDVLNVRVFEEARLKQ